MLTPCHYEGGSSEMDDLPCTPAFPSRRWSSYTANICIATSQQYTRQRCTFVHPSKSTLLLVLLCWKHHYLQSTLLYILHPIKIYQLNPFLAVKTLNKHKWIHSVKDEIALSISKGRRDQSILRGKSICCNGPT